MPVIPLGQKAYQRNEAFVPEVQCLNMFLEKDESGISPDNTLRIQRPGLIASTVLPGIIRGMVYAAKTGAQMAVAGVTLYRDAASVGTINGMGITPMVTTEFGTAVVGGNKAYFYDGATVIPIAMPDNRPVTDVEQLNSYVLLACPDGRFYWLEPGETVVDPLNFATAESSADGLRAIRRVGDDLLMLGSDSGEWWQATGDLDAPFQRVSGRTYERGTLARDTVRRFDNTVMWVGDDCNVYRGGAVPQVVSDSGIAERIRKASSLPSAWVFGDDFHKRYVLRVPGEGTFVFDAATSLWSEWRTEGQSVWLPHVGYEANGVTFAGSSLAGNIWRVTHDAKNDAGSVFTRLVTATVPILGKPPRNDSFTIGTGSSADCTIRLRWKDGQDDYPAFADEIDVRAPIDLATMYRLGQPDQPYRTFEVSCTDDVKLRISGAIVNESWS